MIADFGHRSRLVDYFNTNVKKLSSKVNQTSKVCFGQIKHANGGCRNTKATSALGHCCIELIFIQMFIFVDLT